AMLRLPPVLELDRGPGESDVLRSVADKLSVELESAFDALLTDAAPPAQPLVPEAPPPEASAGRGAAPPTVEAVHEKREGAPKTERSHFAFALQTGAADFVAKPIAPTALAWRVWKILRHRGFVHPAEREAQKEATRAAVTERLGQTG